VKVKELKIGMLLTPSNEGSKFCAIFGGYVIGVTSKENSKLSSAWQHHRDGGRDADSFAIYLGQREDVNVELKLSSGYENGLNSIGWSNRFVLIKDQIFAVEPSEWKNIKQADVGDTDQSSLV
jgi:hypothetical protein